MRPLGPPLMMLMLMTTAAPVAHAATPEPEGVLRATVIEESPTLAAGQMHWDAGRLLIADRGGNRIVEFRPPGTFQEIGQVENPGGVGVDAAGRILVVAGRPSSLQRLVGDAAEPVAAELPGSPFRLLTHPMGTIFWTNFPGGEIRLLDPRGQTEKLEPSIGHSCALAFGPRRDFLYVTSKLPDLRSRTVWRFPPDGDGRPGRGEVFLRTPELEPNLPDLPAAEDGSKTLAGWVGRVQALAIDADGNIYLAGTEAHTSGEAVAVITPDGKALRAMILDVPRNVSSLAVGGDTLSIAVAGPGRLCRVKIR
jgi:sugar lactone lactonase YvrE